MTRSRRNLNEMFPDANATKTYAGSANRLEKFLTNLEDCPTHVIVQRPDGLFLPIVILNDKNSWLMHSAMACHCCVTN